MHRFLPSLCVLAATLHAQPESDPAPAAPLVQVAAIELPGVEGRIDHLAVDAARARVFVAALGNDTLEVVDLKERRHLRSLRTKGEPQGVLLLADEDRLVVTSGAAGTCTVYDAGTLAEVAHVAVGDDADNLRYDASRHLIYVACGNGALAVVDPKSWRVVARIELDAHPEAFAIDAEGKRAFVDVPGAHQVAVVDLGERKVLTTWKIDEAASNYPIALVPGARADAAGLVLVGCRSPGKLVLRALPAGAPAGVLALSGDADDLCYDAQRERVYAACGEGCVDVFVRDGDGFRPLAKVTTAPGARTCAFAPTRDELLVAVPHRGEQRAEVRVLSARD